MNEKILTLLGFAAKSGKLSFGFEAVVSSVKAGKARLAVIAEDVSAKTTKEIIFHCDKASVKAISLNGIDIKTLSHAVGRKCGVISVNDSGFANTLLKEHTQGGNANDE
ncbi:MAG: ribosomal L7Ae/L30e/S12e/Gadd45 family protein [Clostridia bacterium]|nr:ribosomal L7Ae/L30e/S12e/Gadd45 family protein [Clostridia bacterium]